MKTLRLVGLLVPLGTALVGIGCNSTTHYRHASHSEQRLVTTNYEQVFVTGSHIPILVPKSPTARRVQSISPIVILTPEEFNRAAGPGAAPMH